LFNVSFEKTSAVIKTLAETKFLKLIWFQVFSLNWKADGTKLATVSRDNKVRIFDPRSQVSPLEVCSFEKNRPILTPVALTISYLYSSLPGSLFNHQQIVLDRPRPWRESWCSCCVGWAEWGLVSGYRIWQVIHWSYWLLLSCCSC